MKIAYILHRNDFSLKSGVYKKVLSQIKYWSLSGNEVKVFQITKEDMLIDNEYAKWQTFKYDPLSVYDRLIKAWYLVAGEVSNWAPDLVYLRFDVFSPAFSRIAKKFPVVVEVNTDDLKEYCLRRNFKCLYNLFTRKFLFKNASGIVFVSKELSEKSYFAKFKKAYIVIGNGIDLNLYPPNSILNNNNNFNFVFIGSDGLSWHGVDKIVKLAKMRPDWQFHMVGILANGTELPNVKFYGQISRKDYEKIFERADIAIGSLALHRIGVNEISPLKVREYLAYGIPTIIGYKDTDFLNKVQFILELPNCENNVVNNVPEIEKFAKNWKGRRVDRSEISHIDSSVKETERLQFFREIIENAKKL